MNKNIDTINGGIAVDDRGQLRFVNDFDFANVKRFYQVENHSKGFVRAWHGHKKEGKYVYVASGTAKVGAVNLDTEEVYQRVLSAKKPQILWIPPNYANGFMNLEDDTIIIFFSTTTFEESKDDDIRIPWDKWNIWETEYR